MDSNSCTHLEKNQKKTDNTEFMVNTEFRQQMYRFTISYNCWVSVELFVFYTHYIRAPLQYKWHFKSK